MHWAETNQQLRQQLQATETDSRLQQQLQATETDSRLQQLLHGGTEGRQVSKQLLRLPGSRPGPAAVLEAGVQAVL